jgi:hypothetical protein
VTRAGGAAPLARAVLAALVVASVAAFFYAGVLKRETPLLLKPYPGTDGFQPAGGSTLNRAAHFHVRASVGDVLDVRVLTTGGRLVAVLRTGLRVREYRTIRLSWDGRTSSGSLAPPGFYELQVHFLHAARTVVAPGFLMHLEGPAG